MTKKRFRKTAQRLAQVRTRMATAKAEAQDPSWRTEANALESELRIEGWLPSPTILKEWQERCMQLEARKNQRGKARQEIDVLKRLMTGPWLPKNLRPLPPNPPDPPGPTLSSLAIVKRTVLPPTPPSTTRSTSTGSGSSNAPNRSSTSTTSLSGGPSQKRPQSSFTADEHHTTPNDSVHTINNHRPPSGTSNSSAPAQDRVEPTYSSRAAPSLEDLDAPANLETERHTFLSRSNAMPISIGHGTKQGMVLVYPDDLELDPTLERKPFGWRGSGWARVLQDGMDQEVFVDVVVSIPRGARGYAPESASASGSKSGSVGTGSGLALHHRSGSNGGEGSRYRENSINHHHDRDPDRHTRNHDKDGYGGNDQGEEYKETGGKRKRGDDGGAVKRGRYA